MSACFKCNRKVALLPRHNIGECCHDPEKCGTCSETLSSAYRRYTYAGPRGTITHIARKGGYRTAA